MKKRLLTIALLVPGVLSLASCGWSAENNDTETVSETTTVNLGDEDQYKIYLLATQSGYSGTYEQWLESVRGDKVELKVEDGFIQWKYTEESNYSWRNLLSLSGIKGDKGDKGDSGRGIASIEKSYSLGLVDYYTIYFTDGTTFTYTVTNGGYAEETTTIGKTETTTITTNENKDEDHTITIWVSESAGVADLTKTEIDDWFAANTDKVNRADWTIKVEGVSEANAATLMISDVDSGADIFCFAQDQLARLVQAGALKKPSNSVAARLTEANDAGSIKAASVAGELYCYPMTSDNGYFMYYDKSVFKGVDMDSLEDIIARCEETETLFSYEVESSAWYNVGWFFATGCTEEWTTDAEGTINGVCSSFNSANGLIALRGMQKLLKSSCYNSSSSTNDFAKSSSVVVSGIWGSTAAKTALGDDYAATDLPSFTVDGTSYHLGSFSGNKLMGVKPQTNTTKAAMCQLIAEYLTNAACQEARFDLVGWGPSNKEVQALDKVKADPALSALAAQSAYATPQGQIHGSWWTIEKDLCTAAKEADLDDITALQSALTTYQNTINGLFTMSDAEKRAFTVIGAINNTNWDTDFAMTETAEGSNIWISDDTFTFTGEELFRCRQGKSWDVAFPENENYEVNVNGTYKIQLVYDESTNTGTISLIAA